MNPTVDIDHDGYTLRVGPVGTGWRALVYPPGGTFQDIGIRYSDSINDREKVIASARALADEHRAGRIRNGGVRRV